MTTDDTTARARLDRPTRPRGWALREIVALAVLGVVFGFLYFALVQAWGALSLAMGPLGDLSQNVLIGGWMVVAPLALFIIRRPGAGIVAELIAALVEVAFLGSPVGPILLISGFVQGAGAELVFTLTRYRRYGWATFLLSGLSAAIANFIFSGFRFAWFSQDFLWLRLAFQLGSGVLLTGALALLLGRALLRTGVLDDLPAGRDRS